MPRLRRGDPFVRAVRGLPWREAPWTALDVETTGLDLRRDEVISVGAVDVDDGAVEMASSYSSLSRTDRPLTVGSIEVHGLRPADLATAPSPGTVAHELAMRLDGRLLVAHAAWVETAFLGRLARAGSGVGPGQRGRRGPAGGRGRLPTPVVDTAALGRAAGLVTDDGTGREPSLELMVKGLGLPVFSPHQALGDALTTAVLFLALAARLEQQCHWTPLTVAHLVDASAHPDRWPGHQPSGPPSRRPRGQPGRPSDGG